MITLKYIREHFDAKGYVPRHDFKGLKSACNKVAKATGHDAKDLFHLLIENVPVPDAYTHSYGFHTANGRELIEALKSNYYKFINR